MYMYVCACMSSHMCMCYLYQWILGGVRPRHCFNNAIAIAILMIQTGSLSLSYFLINFIDIIKVVLILGEENNCPPSPSSTPASLWEGVVQGWYSQQQISLLLQISQQQISLLLQMKYFWCIFLTEPY